MREVRLIPTISELIESDSLKGLLRQYSESFSVSVFLLAPDRSLILQFPEEASLSEHVMKTVTLRDSTIGYVAVPAQTAFPAALDFICQNLSSIAEMRYEIESLSGEVARNYEELSLLWRISSRLGGELDISAICNVLGNEVMRTCPSNSILVLLAAATDESPDRRADPNEHSAGPAANFVFIPRASLGAASSISMAVFNAGRGLLGEVCEKMEPLTMCDVNLNEKFEGLPFPVTHIMIVPLTVEDTVIGVVVATDKLNGEEYYSTELKLIHAIASECAMSIKKALLYEEIRNILFGVTESFALAIDAKDPYTYGHSKRVSETAAAIAREMGFSNEAVNWIRLAALLHDIGKIGTPEDILHKNAGLSENEMGMMKEHPITGAKMVDNIRRMKEIAHWIRHHHERYDGSGYPSGLAKEDIPVPSRIIAVADYYDALTSDRPYRKSLSKQEAMNIMLKNVGTQLDPVVFEYFSKVISQRTGTFPH